MGSKSRVSRRVLMGGATAAGVTAALGGCASQGHRAAVGTRSGASTTVSATDRPPHTEHDILRLIGAIAGEVAVLAFVSSAARLTPAPVLHLLTSQQNQHVAALKAALDRPFPPGGEHVPARPGDLEANLRTARSFLNTALHGRHVDAMKADSGLLARLFASVAASHAAAAALDSLRG